MTCRYDLVMSLPVVLELFLFLPESAVVRTTLKLSVLSVSSGILAGLFGGAAAEGSQGGDRRLSDYVATPGENSQRGQRTRAYRI